MTTLREIFEEIAKGYDQGPVTISEPEEVKPYCRYHLIDYVDGTCPQCKIDNERGYEVLQLAGRCANGFEMDHGVRYHAVKKNEFSALCGAKPGRRSVGWSPTPKVNAEVTCPRCLKKLGKVQS